MERLLIYGSWAARRAGESGAFPYDIDVLVVGDAPRRTLSRVASDASDQLDVPVNVTRISVEDWEAEDASHLVATVRSRPAVDVMTSDVNA